MLLQLNLITSLEINGDSLSTYSTSLTLSIKLCSLFTCYNLVCAKVSLLKKLPFLTIENYLVNVFTNVCVTSRSKYFQLKQFREVCETKAGCLISTLNFNCFARITESCLTKCWIFHFLRSARSSTVTKLCYSHCRDCTNFLEFLIEWVIDDILTTEDSLIVCLIDT